ncbi:MAG: DNA gyrase subunit A [Chloroflexi bacterium]|nr:DNA gyrase subunit A [Chloroflexota bacterium]
MTSIEPTQNVRPIGIEQEMRSSYLDYAMSVIVARALPEIRDGLKPVQRRILWGAYDTGARAGTGYRKSAGIVGEVLARYHPHGDGPVYEALVRLAQDFSLRYPLIDGQGNFGSVDGDPPAAMRYTEARMAPIAEELLADIDQNTVDFNDNYDGRHKEPAILPSRIPNLLLNGSSGIAVGMATNIPPHHLGEICDAIAMLIDTPESTLDDLLKVVKGPDFPTAGIALVGKDSEQVRLAYGEGHGRITMHARTSIEESARGGRTSIIVTELPYQVNKATLIEKIADLVRDKKIEGISDLRDESDRNGMRIVIDLKKDGSAAQIKNMLFKHTAMRSTFAVNMMAIVDGSPRRVGLKLALQLFIDHRRVVIRRRTEFQLEKARDREHVLAGLLKAIDMLDQVIATIRASESAANSLELLQGQGLVPAERLPQGAPRPIARLAVANPFDFTEIQARAILDMQLRRLAALERNALIAEYQEVIEKIAYLEDLLANPRKIDFLIKDDMTDLKKKYGDLRRTEIVEADPEDFREEDLIPHQDSVITLSIRNYIKRMPLEEFRMQKRGGQGSKGAPTREEDAVMKLVVCDTHDNLLFFTDRGKVYHLRAYDIPDTKKQAKGLPIVNLIEVDPGERVTTILMVKSYEKDFILLATRLGEIKKTLLKEFEVVRRDGKIAMDLAANDSLIAARMATNETTVLLVSSEGQAIRFKIDDLRSASRTSGGVRGMKLATGGYIVGVETTDDGEEMLIISERGFGKRTRLDEYPVQGRGGQGVKTLNITDKTGNVAACRVVGASQELLLVSRDGVVIRTSVDSISRIGRIAQGVTVMRVGETDQVASIAAFTMADEKPARKGKDGAAQPELL